MHPQLGGWVICQIHDLVLPPQWLIPIKVSCVWKDLQGVLLVLLVEELTVLELVGYKDE